MRLVTLSIFPFYWQFVYLHWCYVCSSPPPLFNLFIFNFGCAGSSLLCAGFSLVEGKCGLLLSCVVRPSHCGCFPCCGARALDPWASVVAAHRLSCSMACGNLSGPGIKPVSPVLAGEFLTTGPPVMSLPIFKMDYLSFHH